MEDNTNLLNETEKAVTEENQTEENQTGLQQKDNEPDFSLEIAKKDEQISDLSKRLSDMKIENDRLSIELKEANRQRCAEYAKSKGVNSLNALAQVLNPDNMSYLDFTRVIDAMAAAFQRPYPHKSQSSPEGKANGLSGFDIRKHSPKMPNGMTIEEAAESYK